MLAFIIILQALFFGLLTAFVAGQKGYDVFAFYFIGMVAGPLGMLSKFLPQKNTEGMTIVHEMEQHLMAA